MYRPEDIDEHSEEFKVESPGRKLPKIPNQQSGDSKNKPKKKTDTQQQIWED